MPDRPYNQARLLRHLNQYLKSHKRPLKLETDGHCHGLTLLWLYMMSIKKEATYYDTYMRIIDCNHKAEYLYHTKQIETFLARVEWLQNSREYSDEIDQLNLDELTEFKTVDKIALNFTPQQMNEVIQKLCKENRMMVITGNHHTIGLFLRDTEYYLFDANHHTPVARRYQDTKLLTDSILKALMFPRHPHNLYPVIFNVLEMKKTLSFRHKDFSLFKKYLQEINPELLGKDNQSNLYLNSLNNDEKKIDYLLKMNANPNYPSNNNLEYPLNMAVYYNNIDVTKKLLKHGADVNVINKKGGTPLLVAIVKNNIDMMRLLLDHGAYLHINTKFSYLQAALEFEHYDAAIFLLLQQYVVNKKEERLIRKHLSELGEALINFPTAMNVATEARERLMHYLKSLPPEPHKPSISQFFKRPFLLFTSHKDVEQPSKKHHENPNCANKARSK